MSTAGYSGTPLPKKLGIKEGHRLAVLGAPEEVDLGELPPGVTVVRRAGGTADVIVSFHVDRAHFEQRLPVLRKLMAPASGLWIAWPKKASKVPTDITEDTVREVALPMGLVDVKVCAVDEVWSGLKLVIRRSER